MHREILKCPKGLFIDHINRNGLDNRKNNLRVCSKSQNMMNTLIPKNNTSGYKGVSWSKRDKKWMAYIKIKNKFNNLGYFNIKEQAALAYNDAAKKYHGEFARLNKIERSSFYDS